MSERPSFISSGEATKRNRYKTLITPFVRNEYAAESGDGGLRRAEELSEEGYGILVVFPHFSRLDPLHVIKDFADNPVFFRKRFTSPIAVHQTCPKAVGLLGRAKKSGIDLYPIVTDESVRRADKRGNPQGWELNQGLSEFMNGAADTLKKGGVVFIAPQGTRQPTLQAPEHPTLGTLALSLRRKKVSNYAIHFVGLGIDNVDDYSTVSGLNLRKAYTVNHGPTFTHEEMMQHVFGEVREVDRWATSMMTELVPDAYLPPTQTE